MRLFDAIIKIISNSKLYVNYISQWPAPFNIVSFDAVLLIIFLVVIIRAIWDAANSYHYAVRFRTKQQKLQEERLEQEIKERERDRQREEDNDIIRQYLRFLSMASAHNVLGTNPVSLEEFKDAVKVQSIEEKVEDSSELMSVPVKDTLMKEENQTSEITAPIEADTGIYENIPDPSENNLPEKNQTGQEPSITDILNGNGIDPVIQQEADDDPMSESEFARIMNNIAKKETAKNEAKEKEDRKREITEKNMRELDRQVADSINRNEPVEQRK